MIVRIQGESGTKRVTVQPSDTLQMLKEKAADSFGFKATSISLFLAPNSRNELNFMLMKKPLYEIPISHGDMLYLAEKKTLDSAPTQSPSLPRAQVKVEEDEVDRLLSTRDGLVHRKKDSQLCRHGDNSKCINCVPLEPWDKAVQEGRDPPIKHLSFHCYIRKLTSGVDRGKFANMEDLSCRIKPGCTDHSPWPKGICTKCQPSAITLARQPYRHVDNVMFEDQEIVNRFIEGWRRSGEQRFGYLIGRYEEFTDVPLGIRAIVSAIYEPLQINGRYSLELLEDSLDNEVKDVSALLGLRKVGWIFTDLEPEGTNGKVSYKRNVNTHILSAEECIMAADFQNQFPNPCNLSKTSYFGSKFLTVCVSGDENNQICLKGYQVSNQCMALVRDNCLVPTLDAPELGYVRESTAEQYVPDVFYKTKDEYGDVTRLARPLPLEYLIIELTTSTPIKPNPLLPGGNGHFPITNRELQNFNTLSDYLREQSGVPFLSYMADFHLLLFLYRAESELGIDFKPFLPELCHAVSTGNRPVADAWKVRDSWATLEQLIRSSADSPTSPSPMAFPTSTSTATTRPLPPAYPGGGMAMAQASAMGNGGGGGGVGVGIGGGEWACVHCTYLNQAQAVDCEVCHLPRN